MLRRKPLLLSLSRITCPRYAISHTRIIHETLYNLSTQVRFISKEHAQSAKAQLETDSDHTKPKQSSTAKTSDGKQQKETSNENESEHNSHSDTAQQFVQSVYQRMLAQKERFMRMKIDPRVREEWKEAVREVLGAKDKRSVDEALSSKMTTRSAAQKPKSENRDEETPQYSGTTALVHMKEEDSAWQKISARFREAPIIQSILDAAKIAAKTEAGKKVGTTAKHAKEKIEDAREGVLEFWETSQNPWIYRLSSLYDGFFGETPMGIAIREIRRAEPDFILEKWKENITEYVLPTVLEAFVKGNSRDLKKWFGEAAYSRVNAAIRERKSNGLVMDPNVLGIDNVDVIEASAEDKQAPIVLLRCRSQQINCIRNREGEVVDGAEDEVLSYFYIFAFQRVYDEREEKLRWLIVDIHMHRGDRYY